MNCKHCILTILTILAVSLSCPADAWAKKGKQSKDSHPSRFITVKDGKFMRNGSPYYYIGTNFWYGPILASTGEGGDRERLHKELDYLKAQGIDNLRVLVGSDGKRGVTTKVEPTLQEAPGVYNDTILDGLDYFMKCLADRDMVAVLYLNNSWEWSGGYGFYLEHAGEGVAPRPNETSYPEYMNFVSKFAFSKKAHQLFYDYVRFILSRTNRYTGKRYIDDEAIMSWQIGNEPRAFSDAAKQPFAVWLKEASALIREIDGNHLVSIGSEGIWGCENDAALFEQISADPNVDYLNAHLWPYNWSWARSRHLRADLQRSCDSTKHYIDQHLAIATRLKKPLVLEEFGFPRDGFSFSKESTTTVRDDFYRFVFSLIRDDSKAGGPFAGCNFWGWGGFAEPQHDQWEKGDDYTGDPAQEAQGLNSVFASDESTLGVIREIVDDINKRD